ncbi:MAG: OmpA family protein [Bacteroidetes bacterium]|nr:OmpA family protein [Bacteroidota bacterium]
MARIVAILTLLWLSVAFYSVSAQDTKLSTSNKKAIKLYQDAGRSFILGETDGAKKLLLDAIKKDPEFAEAWVLLGDVNTELNRPDDAVADYKKALQIKPSKFYYANYLIGNHEFSRGNYNNALDYYKAFLNAENLSDKELLDTKSKIENTKIAIQIIGKPLDIEMVRLGQQINSPADEFINFVDEKSEFLYLTRKEENPAYHLDANPYRENFYYASFKNNQWDSLKLFPLPISKSLNTGAMNFSIDRRQLFITGCSWPNSFGSCDLFQLQKQGSKWTNVINLGGIVNSKYWDSQAILSSDGKTLYFASRRSGGIGGSDIWKSEKQNDGLWGAPINLGESINTAGNEMAPYIHADTKTFYFSSDTRPGLGGYDLFMSEMRDDGTWNKSENLGTPVNSENNEINIFISIDATHAWISSDREGGYGGFDIYEFETDTSIKPELVVYVKGIVVDVSNQKPISAAVELTNLERNTSVIQLQSDPENGSFFIPVYPGTDYAFNISKTGYLFYSENFNFRDSLLCNSIEKTFELIPIQQGTSMVLKNVFFEFDSDSLQPSSFPELDLLIEFLHENPELKISINGHTDNIGSDMYNKTLSENRALAVRNYLIKRDINPSRLFAKGYGASQPIEPNETPEGRANNRRTEIVIL